MFLVSGQWKNGNFDSWLVMEKDVESAKEYIIKYMNANEFKEITGAKEIDISKPGIVNGINTYV